jgi:beta-galactosidase
MVVEFSENQVDILRDEIQANQWITTNIIATYWEIDFYKLAKKLDFISWDSYTMIDATSPIRHPQFVPSPPVVFPPRPEMYSLVHDMMRSFSNKPFWVMETAGQDRLVAYHTMAHGGGGVNFFRWKGVRFGAEQSRSGYEHHGIFSDRFIDAQKVTSEFKKIAELVSKTQYKSQVGLLYSFDMGWAYDISKVYPRSVWMDGVGYWRLIEEYYKAFWKENIPVDPVNIEDDLLKYQILIVPCLYLTTPELDQKLANYVENGGILIVGPASGTKDWNNVYLENIPLDGKLKDVFGAELIGTGKLEHFGSQLNMKLTEDSPFAKGEEYPCKLQSIDSIGFFSSTRPVEVLKATNAKVFGHYSTGQSACTINKFGKGKAIYLGFSPDDEFLQELIAWLQREMGIDSPLSSPEGVEITKRVGNNIELTFIVNHSFEPKTIFLEEKYLDLVNNTVVQGEVRIMPQHSFVLKNIGGK